MISARHRTALVLAVLAAWVAAAAWASPAAAQAADPSAPEWRQGELALARAYAPVVRLAEHGDACDDGEPYQPVSIDLLMDDDEIALRGPWDTTNIVAIAPGADDLARGLHGYHLDFPGDTLRPGCTFAAWSARLAAEAPPATYARVVTEAGRPGKLALQYWFFYVFNDWNNSHEGDWEMIQIVFDADTPAQALANGPREVGYSQHSSAERAAWGDEKMEIVDRTHPVVYPAAGSHANFFSSDLYLMRSSAEGVGCDDTRGPSREIRPEVIGVPTERAAYLARFGWLGFEGRWGERHAGVFNGPTGPNDKTQWSRPITWSQESWRSESFTVPGGGALGTSATDAFCGAMADGSALLRRAKANPGVAAAIIGGLAVLLAWGLSRTAWTPASPLPAARRRSWGRLITASGRMLAARPRTFLGIGLLFVPLGLLITGLQWLLFRATALTPLVDEAGERNAFVAALVLGLGLVFTLLGYAVVQAAVARVVLAADAGRTIGAVAAYRAVLGRLGPLLGALAILVAVQLVLDATVILIPVAIFLLVRWSLLGVVAGHEEGLSAWRVLRRSAAVAQGQWMRTASIALVAIAALLAGPVVGILALIATGAAFDLVNMIAAVVYVVALPYAALVTNYLYLDLRARPRPAPAEAGAEAEQAAAPA